MQEDKLIMYYKEVEELANQFIIDYYFQQYPGANMECLYCGEYKGKPHNVKCPNLLYINIKKKYGVK